MKILEAQSAVLTNVEVLEFLNDRRARHAQEQPPRRRGPDDFEDLLKQVIQYLKVAPGPLSQEPIPFGPASIPTLVKKLHRYQLTKTEMVMIVNHRPTTFPQLHACIDEIRERLSDDQVQEILDIIAEVLGGFPPKPDADEEEGEPEVNGASDAEPVQSIETATL